MFLSWRGFTGPDKLPAAGTKTDSNKNGRKPTEKGSFSGGFSGSESFIRKTLRSSVFFFSAGYVIIKKTTDDQAGFQMPGKREETYEAEL